MFLTTNRVQTFDTAFESRIHISLEYKELDKKSRKAVWQNFLAQHDVAQQAARDRPPQPLASAAKADGKSEEKDEKTLAEEKEVHRKLTLPHEIKGKDIDKLADLRINGRQIKNVLKSAQLLANVRQQALSYTHVDDVMNVTQHLHKATEATDATKSSLFS